MTSVCCILIIFFISVITTLLGVLYITSSSINESISNNNSTCTSTKREKQQQQSSSSFHFRFYNPLSYKTISSSTKSSAASNTKFISEGSQTNTRNHHHNPIIIENYYSNPNHSIWDGLLIKNENDDNSNNNKKKQKKHTNNNNGVYTLNDFRNDNDIAPPYWNCVDDDNNNNKSDQYCSNIQQQTIHHGITIGPCFVPRNYINWTQQIHSIQNDHIYPLNMSDPISTSFLYQKQQSSSSSSSSSSNSNSMIPNNYKLRNNNNNNNNFNDDWSNYCRPGFIIIGAGKCGTSSLYHYLIDHPRILPAKSKQIHYYKYYYTTNTIQWYYNFFPTSISFLSSGALLTGEASPGYLPYPDVAYTIYNQTTYTSTTSTSHDDDDIENSNGKKTTGKNNKKKENIIYTGPKIITVGREPIDRAYSSYKYNYVSPAIDSMKRGQYKHIQKLSKKERESTINSAVNDTYYEQFLFSFEEMILAELDILNECLNPINGTAILGAKERWGNESWIQKEYKRRTQNNLPSLTSIDEHCYGDIISQSIPRKQWITLMNNNPTKIIDDKNLHLKQSLIGRGLYTLPLEWWYSLFPNDQLFFVCTEELSDPAGTTLNKLGQFLGLPTNSYNFSQSILKGAYNVAGFKGYDTEISWNELHSSNSSSSSSSSSSSTVNSYDIKTDIDNKKKLVPLSDETRQRLQNFINPYNERLFKLIGRRCSW